MRVTRRTYHTLRRRMRRLKGVMLRLRPADLPTLLQIVRLVSRYQYLHDRRSLPSLVAAFDTPATNNGLDTDLSRLTYLIDLVMRGIYRDRYCMKRSLIHFYYMRRAGMLVSLNFGIAKEQSGVAGHAWVEVDGCPYGERRDPRARFVQTFVYPREGTAGNSPALQSDTAS